MADIGALAPNFVGAHMGFLEEEDVNMLHNRAATSRIAQGPPWVQEKA